MPDFGTGVPFVRREIEGDESEVWAVVATLMRLLPGIMIGQMKSTSRQNRSHLGQVTDATGAPVPDVAVVLKLVGSAEVIAHTKTGETGEFTFLAVAHRSYEIRFECPGFRPETKMVIAEKDADVGAWRCPWRKAGSDG